MKESAFRTSVLRNIPKDIHNQPNPATFMGHSGTPDHYFDNHTDLWVEWKVLRRDNHFPAVVPEDSMPSPVQLRWLNRRYAAGGNACVIVGIKVRARAYGFVLETPEQWARPPLREWYEPRLRPSADLAAYIVQRIT